MTHILAVANQKGGVGKTTTSMNLAASLVRLKQSTLLIDLDQQGNASVGLGIDHRNAEYSTWDMFVDAVSPKELVTPTSSGVDVICSNSDLAAIEMRLLNLQDRNFRLRTALAKVATYQYILLDCPPSLNVVTLNALMAATGVLIPMQCEYFALEGLSSLVRTLDAVRSAGNSKLVIDGLLRCMFDPRSRLTNDVARQLFEYFPQQVYRTVIPRNVKLAEAPSHGLPAIEYAPTCRGAIAYLALANEMIRRHRTQPSAVSNVPEAEVTP